MALVGVVVAGLALLGLYWWDASKYSYLVRDLIVQAERANRSGDSIKAARLLERALQLHPQGDELHELGVASCAAGKTADGIALFEGRLRDQPEDSSALRELVECRLKAGQLARALEGQRELVAMYDRQEGSPHAKLSALQAQANPPSIDLESLSLPVRLVRSGPDVACYSDEVLLGGGCGSTGLRTACAPRNGQRYDCEVTDRLLCVSGAWNCPPQPGVAEATAPAFALCVPKEFFQ